LLAHVGHTGKGPTVVMLHGWGASSLIFERIIIPRMRRLGADYNFIAIDLPGHGKNGNLKSPKGLKRSEIIQYIADSVVETLDELGVEEFVLLGYSFGATIALHIAAKHKNRVKALVVNDPILNGKEFELYRRWSFHLMYNLLKPIGETRFILKIVNNNWADALVKKLIPNLFRHTRPDDSGLKKEIDDIKHYDKRNTNPKFWATGIDALFAHSAQFSAMKVSCSTLILSGDGDIYNAANTAEKLQKLILAKGTKQQTVKVEFIKNSGHHIMSTNPDEVASEITIFLKEYYK